jgi:nucleoside-triphosphatase THEP1
MILFVTGPLHSGKTTFVKQLISRLSDQALTIGGYITPAVFEDDERTGYDLMDLKTGHLSPFLRKEGQPGLERVGAYFFIQSGLEKAASIIGGCPADICIIDEIGPLELAGGGLWPPISELLSRRTSPILFVVRDFLAARFVPRFPGRRIFVFDIRQKNASSRIQALLVHRAG